MTVARRLKLSEVALVRKMWKNYLKSCESYDYEGEPSNTNEEQFAKVFIDENLLPKEHEEFEDDLHVEDQGTVLIFFCLWR